MTAPLGRKSLRIAFSFALQHGVPLESMRSAMPRTADGSPEGPMGTLLDLLAEEKS